ncbi:MAG: ATP-binding protein [Acidimicrobiia bacterium]
MKRFSAVVDGPAPRRSDEPPEDKGFYEPDQLRSRMLGISWTSQRGAKLNLPPPPKVTLKLLSSLAAIALVAVAGWAFSAYHLDHLDAGLINDAGRQRFLSQRIALNAVRLAIEPDVGVRQDLRAALAADASTLSRVQPTLAHDHTPPDLDKMVGEYAARAGALAQVPDGELTPDGPDLRALVAAGDEVLARLDAFVTELELHFESHLSSLKLSAIIALGAVLVSLLGLGPFVFLPMARRIRRETEALEVLARSKDELIASVSHELRTPLTAILGFAEVLRADRDDLPPSERSDLLELIARESEDVAGIVEDLLAASRVEIGKLAVIRVQVSLRAQLAQVLESRVDPSGARIEVPDSSVRAWGDPARVRQIVRNLVSNAIRHGGEHCWIRISASDTTASLMVCDDGPGVPDVDAEAIFSPYHTANKEMARPGSVGLGLTLSRRLARLMGGDLTYRREDGHTVFELTLPLVEEPSTT